MAKECFCGCGRDVPFGRKRVTNMLGHQVTGDIALFEGSIARTPDPEHDADLRRLIATGIPLRDKLREVIHGTLDRDDFPREEGKRWLEEANEHRKRMAMQMVDADFAGWNGVEQSQLLRAGIAAPATIVDVADTGTTINESPRVELTLRVEPSDGTEPFELRRKLVVSRVKLPHVGERLTVFYDRDDPTKFTFKNEDAVDRDAEAEATAATAAEPDPVDQIARLAELHAKGALSDAEFTEAKQRLLADL
jgi:Short C-terminal domain